jgi:hypothetical protein
MKERDRERVCVCKKRVRDMMKKRIKTECKKKGGDNERKA